MPAHSLGHFFYVRRILYIHTKIWRLPFREIFVLLGVHHFFSNGMCSRFSVLSAGGVRQFAKEMMDIWKRSGFRLQV